MCRAVIVANCNLQSEKTIWIKLYYFVLQSKNRYNLVGMKPWVFSWNTSTFEFSYHFNSLPRHIFWYLLIPSGKFVFFIEQYIYDSTGQVIPILKNMDFTISSFIVFICNEIVMGGIHHSFLLPFWYIFVVHLFHIIKYQTGWPVDSWNESWE